MFLSLNTIIEQNKKIVLDFDYMYNTYKNKIWVITYECLSDKQFCDDAMQDIFRKFYIHNKRKIFENEYQALKWLKKTAISTAKDYNKKTAVFNEHIILTDDNDKIFDSTIQTSENTPLDNIIREELISKVRQAIRDLKPIYHETLELCCLMDWSVKEVSEKFNIPLDTVYSRLKKGKAFLREHSELTMLMEVSENENEL